MSKIQETTSQSEWRHISTKENPADVISRGCCPSKLVENLLWWNGPEWICQDEREWPEPLDLCGNVHTEDNIILEIKEKSTYTMCATAQSEIILHCFSSFSKCLRVTAYCLRFKNNALRKNKRSDGPLCPEELKTAKLVLIKLVQSTSFKSELVNL